jgi:dihydrofolate reductase
MEGGTTFTFVTDGIESALEQARDAAGDAGVAIAGGAETVNQYLAAGLIDELRLHVAPLLLGPDRGAVTVDHRRRARQPTNKGDPCKLPSCCITASPR